MRVNHNKKSIGLVTALCMALALFIISGCGSESSSPSVKQYAGKVAYIGDPSGTLADEIDQIFVNSVQYDGSSTDMPVFIAAQNVLSLTEDQKQWIRDTFANGEPIVVVHGGETEINALYTVLGLEKTYTLPEGLPEGQNYAELFAIVQLTDKIAIWTMYPPTVGRPVSDDPDAPQGDEDTDSDEDQLDRAEMFLDWIDEEIKRSSALKVNFAASMANKVEASKAIAAVAGENAELTAVAKSFHVTNNFSAYGNYYTVTYYIYSCHSFSESDGKEYDWFYVRQEGQLNAKNAYKGIQNWYLGLQTDNIHYYIGSYRMNNWMDGLTQQGSGVSLVQSSPANENKSEQVTSGVSVNISGKVGFSGKGATGDVGAGLTITNSKSFSVKDCDLVNNSGDKFNNANWSYNFKKASQTAYFAYSALNEPPLLSRSLFQPVNQWVWKFSSDIRDKNQNWFYSQFDVDLINSMGGVVLFWVGQPPSHSVYPNTWKEKIPLPFPPLIVAQRNLDFNSSKGSSTALDITVSRDWTASSNQPWCQLQQSAGTAANTHINITVDENTTGAGRTAVLTFKTADGKGTATTTVFQPK